MIKLGWRARPNSAESARHVQWQHWADALLHPANGLLVFSILLLVVYGLVPALIYVTVLPSQNFLLLAGITLVGVVSMGVGVRIPLLDGRFRMAAPRFEVDWRWLLVSTWVCFALFVLVTFVTAPAIPLVSALKGTAPDVLSQERGEFLKGRQGAQIALLYLSTVLVNTVVPYSIVLAYATRLRVRHLLAAAFFLFSVSFLQKALFLNLALPLLAYFAIKRELKGGRAAAWLAGSLFVLFAGAYLSLGAGNSGGLTGVGAADVLTAQFAPSNPLEYLVWRALVVPIFTATDTLVVHAQYFDGRPLLGATSSLIAWVFGMERVNLERVVFEYQFGGWNDIANANAVFLVDAFVNFAWGGVVLFGLVVGQIFRWFRLSRDVGFSSLWPLFAFVLFSGPLIGMMLSNGFMFILLYALLIRPRFPRIGSGPPLVTS